MNDLSKFLFRTNCVENSVCFIFSSFLLFGCYNYNKTSNMNFEQKVAMFVGRKQKKRSNSVSFNHYGDGKISITDSTVNNNSETKSTLNSEGSETNIATTPKYDTNKRKYKSIAVINKNDNKEYDNYTNKEYSMNVSTVKKLQEQDIEKIYVLCEQSSISAPVKNLEEQYLCNKKDIEKKVKEIQTVNHEKIHENKDVIIEQSKKMGNSEFADLFKKIEKQCFRASEEYSHKMQTLRKNNFHKIKKIENKNIDNEIEWFCKEASGLGQHSICLDK